MRREVADGMIKAYMHLQQKYLSEGFQNALRTAISALEQPEIIRCKDCQHYVYGEDEEQYYCRQTGIGTEEDFYCASGERREE